MNISELRHRRCQPCKAGDPSLDPQIASRLASELGWTIDSVGHLTKKFTFPDFKEALSFTNKVGEIAEAEDHHPDILLQWGKVTITLYTHSIKGLSLNDFILASQITSI